MQTSSKTSLIRLEGPNVQTISEHTTKVRSVFRNSEIKRLNGPTNKPTTDSIQNPKFWFYCSRHKTYARDKILKFKYNARALQMLQMKTSKFARAQKGVKCLKLKFSCVNKSHNIKVIKVLLLRNDPDLTKPHTHSSIINILIIKVASPVVCWRSPHPMSNKK